MTDAYTALLAEAERLGWPLYYKNDLLVLDREICDKLATGEKFVWAIRDCGTHIVRGDSVEVRMNTAMVERAFSGSDTRFYFWNGERLVPFEVKSIPRLREIWEE